MKETNIVRDIESLPPDARKLVKDFVAFLKIRFADEPRTGKKPRAMLADEPFVGMWRDHEDIRDGASWVRNLRKNEWGPGE